MLETSYIHIQAMLAARRHAFSMAAKTATAFFLQGSHLFHLQAVPFRPPSIDIEI